MKATTYVKHDPVLYQFMLRAGDTKYYWEQKALERFRNGIEALFASMKRRGNGQAGIGKAMWDETFQEAYWMMSATLLGITLGRVVHHSGEYERVHADMVERDLI